MSWTVIALVTLAFSLTGAPGAAIGAEWTVNTIPTEDKSGTRCVVESKRESVWDGYQKTTAYLSVAPNSVSLISAVPFDGSATDFGLAVDDETFIRMDRLGGEKVASFDSKADRLIAQFKAGLRARVKMRFWPTWPATGAHEVTFSLIGFTRAYTELSGCR